MGDEVFDSFARAYLIYHPSTSFTLYDLGKAFPCFLAKTKPATAADDEDPDFMSLPIALAKLERARQEAMRAPGTEGGVIQRDDPGIQDILFNTVNVVTPACLQLLELEYPMVAFFKSVYRDEDYELPSPQKTYTAVSRKNFDVTMMELTKAQYTLLSLCQTGDKLYDAINATASFCNIQSSNLLADVFLWMPHFRQNGVMDWV